MQERNARNVSWRRCEEWLVRGKGRPAPDENGVVVSENEESTRM